MASAWLPRPSPMKSTKFADPVSAGAQHEHNVDGQHTISTDVVIREQACLCLDPNLQVVVKAWPGLPEAVRDGILAMVLALQ